MTKKNKTKKQKSNGAGELFNQSCHICSLSHSSQNFKKGAKPMKRQKMRRKKDKKVYTQTANTIKKINVAPRISRGGIRL